MKNTPNIYFQEYLKNGKERWKPLLIAAFSFRHRHVCIPLIYGETIYYIYIYIFPIYLYLLGFFFSIWKLPTSVKGSIVTIHCDKCCGKGGIFFFCPQNKAMLMFTHRCLCLREFYSRKDHCYQWLAKHRIQIFCELNPGLWLAAGVWAVPSKWWDLGLLRGWAAPPWCSRVTKWNWLVPLPPSFTLLRAPRRIHGCPSL